MIVQYLEDRFKECIVEKNCTLIRYDIVEVLRKLYDQVHDEAIKNKALALIDTETDMTYRKKYAGVWRDIIKENKAIAAFNLNRAYNKIYHEIENKFHHDPD